VGVAGERAVTAAWLQRNGRLYELVAVAAEGSRLYRSSERRGRDFWLVRTDGSERPWNYRTQFGRKRPLPPPTGRWQRPAG
jgi:hypothetical protein